MRWMLGVWLVALFSILARGHNTLYEGETHKHCILCRNVLSCAKIDFMRMKY